MAASPGLPPRLTIAWKMAMISVIGLVGLLALAGIGYWASVHLNQSAAEALGAGSQAREQLAEATDLALGYEAQARALADLNSGLIALQQVAVDGPTLRKKGITAEDVLRQANELAIKAEMVRQVPGSDRPIPGTKGKTLADVVVGNFADIAVLIEFELPDLYLEAPGSPAFFQKQGSMLVSMTRMYWFISKTLGELTENIRTEVGKARQELSRVSDDAEALSGAVRAEMAEEAAQTEWWLVGTFLVIITVLGTVFPRFFFSIVGPLKKTVAMAEDLRKGRVASRLDVGRRNDEFADMARAMNAFADSLEHEVASAMQAMASGHIDVEVHPVDDKDIIRGALQKMAADMNQMLLRVQEASSNLTISSGKVSDSSQSLSQGATEQASSLEEISSSLTELGAQTSKNADHASEANRLSSQAQQAAQDGNVQMQHMVEAIAELSEAGQDISKIIKAIDEIAFQTNLLALNAAVEAARAGQHGKGFAVVAEEVRNLAARSAKAAQETSELIRCTVEKTARGSEIAHQNAEALTGIYGGISKVSELVEEIAFASKEQAEGIGQINIGLGQIDEVTQRNTAHAEQSAASAEQLNGEASQLRLMLQRFKLKAQGLRLAAQPAVEFNQEAGDQSSWGMTAKTPPRIALDDEEFGRY